jgi:predicted secreted acid phosphatase
VSWKDGNSEYDPVKIEKFNTANFTFNSFTDNNSSGLLVAVFIYELLDTDEDVLQSVLIPT